MGVGENDRVKLPIAERAEVRERFLALLFRMHAGVEDEALAGRFEVIGPSAQLAEANERRGRHGVAAGNAGVVQVLVAGDEALVIIGGEKEPAAIFVLKVFQ